MDESGLNVSVSRGNKLARVNIKDLDALTTESDVVGVVSVNLGITADRIEVGKLRPFYGGNQAITLGLEAGVAKRLIAMGKIIIGLNLCIIQERINVIQCYKCWKYGHLREECKEAEDNSRACRKCAQERHKEKECTLGKTICLNCKQEGHRAGAGSCPEFKKALARARLLKKKKKAY